MLEACLRFVRRKQLSRSWFVRISHFAGCSKTRRSRHAISSTTMQMCACSLLDRERRGCLQASAGFADWLPFCLSLSRDQGARCKTSHPKVALFSAANKYPRCLPIIPPRVTPPSQHPRRSISISIPIRFKDKLLQMLMFEQQNKTKSPLDRTYSHQHTHPRLLPCH